MRVLITNNTLAERAGSEMYVRDLALALLRRGHDPIACSTLLGDVANELRKATVPVVDDLSQVAAAPDVIHGQHHVDAMIAMLHFPQTPAIYTCHGWMPWEELPPKFPTLRHYIAVDDLCAERLQSENGIAPEYIHILRNFVDLRRFHLRAELPEKPARALVFSNSAHENGYLGTIRRALAERGIAVDAIGAAMQRNTADPEKWLGDYDLVFAKGRSAMEAMACGAAVITCDAVGMAGMVTPKNFATWRRLNFGVRTLNGPITAETILREVDRYDAKHARQVAVRLRAEADMEPVIDEIVKVYERAIDDHHSSKIRPPQEFVAASGYLRQIAGTIKTRYVTHLQLLQANRDIAEHISRTQDAERRLLAANAALEAERQAHAAESQNLEAERQAREAVRQAYEAERQAHEAERQAYAVERQAHEEERQARAASDLLAHSHAERAELAEQRTVAVGTELYAERQALTASNLQLQGQSERAARAEQQVAALSSQLGAEQYQNQANAAALRVQSERAEHLERECIEMNSALQTARRTNEANAPVMRALSEQRSALLSVRRTQAEEQELLDAIEQEVAQRSDRFRAITGTPFWNLLGRAFSVRNSYGSSLGARLRLLFAQNTGDELIESIQSGALADHLALTDVEAASSRTLRQVMASLVERYRIRSVVEMACGHCLWLRGSDVNLDRYIGIDSASDAIERNRQRFAARNYSFISSTDVSIPSADAVLCRDWLEYLPLGEGADLVARLRVAGQYLVATNHQAIGENIESAIGGWRPLNLQRDPFNLGEPLERFVLDERTGKTLTLWANA